MSVLQVRFDLLTESLAHGYCAEKAVAQSILIISRFVSRFTGRYAQRKLCGVKSEGTRMKILVLALLWSSLLNLAVADFERPSTFVALSHWAPDIRLDMRYATERNFLGRVVAGYEAPECWLTKPAAIALQNAQRVLARDGLGLIVFDCYRPERAVADFVQWSLTGDIAQKQAYYPRTAKSELFAAGYIADRSSHSRGATVDVAIYAAAGQSRESEPIELEGLCRSERQRMREAGLLDFGSGYDCFDIVSHTGFEALDSEAIKNRQLLLQIMQNEGFVNYAKEWWHFTLEPEPYPGAYFDFPVSAMDAALNSK